MMNKKNCLKLRYDKLKIFHLRSTIKLHKKFLQKRKLLISEEVTTQQRKITPAKFHDKILRIIHALFSTQRVDPNVLSNCAGIKG